MKAFLPKITRERTTFLLAIGLGLLFIALSPGRLVAFDVGIRNAVAHALWRHATPVIPLGGPFDDGLIPVAGGGVSFYGIGQSLLFVPFDLLGTLLAKLARIGGVSDATAGFLATLPIVFLYVPAAALAWWLGTARLLRELGLARGTALRASAVFAVSTTALVYCAQTAQEESVVGALLAFGLAIWLRALRTGQGAFLAGLLAASAVAIRLNAGLAGLFFLGAAIDSLRTNRARAFRAMGHGIAGASIPMTIVGFFAWVRFGSPFSTGYDLGAAHGLGVVWTTVRPWLAIAFVLGAGKGVWLLSPSLWFAGAGIRAAFGRRPGLWTGVVLAWLASCLLHSSIVFNPDGSECWGVRYLIHLLTPFAYPMALGLLAWRRRGVGGRRLVAGVVGASVAFQAIAFVAPDSTEYNQADLEGRPRNELISGLTTGQFSRRLSNVATWLSAGTVIPAQNDAAAPAVISLTRIETAYVPNLWPVVYAKRTESGAIRSLLLIFALAIASGSAWCLRAGFRPRRRRSPVQRAASSSRAA